MNRKTIATPTSVRCAVYTRKSTEEGLEQEFNSLDAQRESAEAYIASQKGAGWECLPQRYDDGGFTGGNMDRPALRSLMADIEAGKVDCVVVYKVDRLSRSLLDFARMMESFDRHRVSFVSVTQQFNTVHSMGRLTLNILLSFAQFEREIIGERTRDKIAAARRKGKWAGGHPVLGYDVDPRVRRLTVNAEEAAQVRAIFELYLEHGSLLATVAELGRRGWTGKRRTTGKGRERGGRPLDRTGLYKVLTNPIYIGKVKYKDELHAGEHVGLIEPAVWQRVQERLRHNGRTGGAEVRNRFGAILKGILRCAACDCAMTPTHTTRNGNLRYRYYLCTRAQARGRDSCPAPSIPAAGIEQVVTDRLRAVGRDPELARLTVAAAQERTRGELARLEAQRRTLERDMARWSEELRVAAVAGPGAEPHATARLADLHERLRTGEQRASGVCTQMDVLRRGMADEREVMRTLAEFDGLWAELSPREQASAVRLLVRQVNYDGAAGKVSITFQPGVPGIGART